MKKQILFSILAVGIATIFLGAGTISYFSDTETSLGNTLTDGTFDLEIDGNSLPFKAWNIMPGWKHSETHGVENIGSLSGEVNITAKNFTDPGTYYGGYYAEPDEPEPSIEVSPEDFAKILYMKIEADLDGDHTYETLIYNGPVYGMESDLFSIDPGEYIECKFTAYLPIDLDDPMTPENEDDNLYQADGVAFDIVFYGTTNITIR